MSYSHQTRSLVLCAKEQCFGIEERGIASGSYVPQRLTSVVFGTVLLKVGCVQSCTYMCKTSGVHSSGGAMHRSAAVCRGSGALAPSAATEGPQSKYWIESRP